MVAGGKIAGQPGDGPKTLSRQGHAMVVNTSGNWDGEVAGMTEALEQGPHDRGVLILADSMAAIQAVKKAGRSE